MSDAPTLTGADLSDAPDDIPVLSGASVPSPARKKTPALTYLGNEAKKGAVEGLNVATLPIFAQEMLARGANALAGLEFTASDKPSDSSHWLDALGFSSIEPGSKFKPIGGLSTFLEPYADFLGGISSGFNEHVVRPIQDAIGVDRSIPKEPGALGIAGRGVNLGASAIIPGAGMRKLAGEGLRHVGKRVLTRDIPISAAAGAGAQATVNAIPSLEPAQPYIEMGMSVLPGAAIAAKNVVAPSKSRVDRAAADMIRRNYGDDIDQRIAATEADVLPGVKPTLGQQTGSVPGLMAERSILATGDPAQVDLARFSQQLDDSIAALQRHINNLQTGDPTKVKKPIQDALVQLDALYAQKIALAEKASDTARAGQAAMYPGDNNPANPMKALAASVDSAEDIAWKQSKAEWDKLAAMPTQTTQVPTQRIVDAQNEIYDMIARDQNLEAYRPPILRKPQATASTAPQPLVLGPDGKPLVMAPGPRTNQPTSLTLDEILAGDQQLEQATKAPRKEISFDELRSIDRRLTDAIMDPNTAKTEKMFLWRLKNAVMDTIENHADPALRDQLKAAKAAYKDAASLFLPSPKGALEPRPLSTLVRGTNDPVNASNLLKSGVAGDLPGEHLNRAFSRFGGDRTKVRDALMQKMNDTARNADGTWNMGKVDAFVAEHRPLLQQLTPEGRFVATARDLIKRADDYWTKQKTNVDTTRELGKIALEDFDATTAGKLLKTSPEAVVDALITEPSAQLRTQGITNIMGHIGKDAEALNGFKRTLLDRIQSKATVDGALDPAKFKAALDAAEPVVKEILSPAEFRRWQIARKNADILTRGETGVSFENAGEGQIKNLQNAMYHGSVGMALATGHSPGLAYHGSKGIGERIIGRMPGVKKVNATLRDVVLNPKLAAALLAQNPAGVRNGLLISPTVVNAASSGRNREEE